MWTVAVFGTKQYRFRLKTVKCGRGLSQTESFNHSGEKEDVKLGTKTSRVTAARLAAMHGQACVPVQRKRMNFRYRGATLRLGRGGHISASKLGGGHKTLFLTNSIILEILGGTCHPVPLLRGP